jgi:hypothetical protein
VPKSSAWHRSVTRWCAIYIRNVLNLIAAEAIDTERHLWHVEEFDEVFVWEFCHENRNEGDNSPALIWNTTKSSRMIRWDNFQPKTAGVRARQAQEARQNATAASETARIAILRGRAIPPFPVFAGTKDDKDTFFTAIQTPLSKKRGLDNTEVGEVEWTPLISFIIVGRLFFHFDEPKPMELWKKLEQLDLGGIKMKNLYNGDKAQVQVSETRKAIQKLKRDNGPKYLKLKRVCLHGKEFWNTASELQIFRNTQEEEKAMSEHIEKRDFRAAIEMAENGVMTPAFLVHLARLRSSYNNAMINSSNPPTHEKWLKENVELAVEH